MRSILEEQKEYWIAQKQWLNILLDALVVGKLLFSFSLFFLLISCSQDTKNKNLTGAPINIAKVKVLRVTGQNGIYVFGLIENVSSDTIYLFNGYDQVVCLLDSFQYKSGEYSYDINCGLTPFTRLDLYSLKPDERRWFFLENEHSDELSNIVSARFVVFWASDNDSVWSNDNKYIKQAIFRRNINEFEFVRRPPIYMGFKDIEIPIRND